MSLYQCEECGCRENTATGAHWDRERKLCCVCDGGEWHGHFPRLFLPIGMFLTNSEGNLAHRDTGETDLQKYALDAPDTEREEQR